MASLPHFTVHATLRTQEQQGALSQIQGDQRGRATSLLRGCGLFPSQQPYGCLQSTGKVERGAEGNGGGKGSG